MLKQALWIGGTTRKVIFNLLSFHYLMIVHWYNAIVQRPSQSPGIKIEPVKGSLVLVWGHNYMNGAGGISTLII